MRIAGLASFFSSSMPKTYSARTTTTQERGRDTGHTTANRRLRRTSPSPDTTSNSLPKSNYEFRTKIHILQRNERPSTENQGLALRRRGPRLRAKGFLAACDSDRRKVNAVRGGQQAPMCCANTWWQGYATSLTSGIALPTISLTSE